MTRPTSLKGFTLIELLIVIVIIGILSAGGVALFTGTQARARDAARQSAVSTLSTAIEKYRVDHEDVVLSAAADPQPLYVTAGVLSKAFVAPSATEYYCYYAINADAAATPPVVANTKYGIAAWLEGSSKVFTGGDIPESLLAAAVAADFKTAVPACPAAAGYTAIPTGLAS